MYLKTFLIVLVNVKKIINFSCAGIKKPVFDIISIIPNFSWRCCECIDFYKINIQKSDQVMNSIASIAATLNVLKDTSSVMNNKLEKIIKPIRLQSPSTVKSNKKQIELDARVTRSMQNQNIITAADTVTPITQPLSNSTESAKIIIGSGSIDSALRTVEPVKWIFVSRLCKDVKDDDVISYIKSKFEIDKPVLNRMNRNDDRDYVSFKIGVPVNKLEQLLDSSLWPPGVLIKEFLTYRRYHSNRFLVPRSALAEQKPN